MTEECQEDFEKGKNSDDEILIITSAFSRKRIE